MVINTLLVNVDDKRVVIMYNKMVRVVAYPADVIVMIAGLW